MKFRTPVFFRRMIPLLIVLPLLAPPARAQREIEIRGRGAAVSVMDFSPFDARGAAASEFLSTLRRNLVISGAFRDGAPSEAHFVLRGRAAPEDGRLRVMVEVVSAGNNQRRFAQGYVIEPGRARALGRRVSDEILSGVLGQEGFARRRIVFVGQQPGESTKELFAMFPDGGDRVQLTRFNSVVLGPRWTPDGESVVYTSYHRGFPDVVRQNLRTGALDTIAAYPGLNTGGAISPDGRFSALVLSRDGKPELYVKDLRTNRLARLTNTPASAKSSPSWSPDGSQIVFVSGHQGRPHLYIIGREGGGPRRITTGGSENVSPVWGKNGLIAFTRRIGGVYRTAVINPENGEIQLISPDGANYEDPSWAPNGRHIVVSRTIGGQSSLHLLDTRGGAPIALLREPGNWYMPTWQP